MNDVTSPTNAQCNSMPTATAPKLRMRVHMNICYSYPVLFMSKCRICRSQVLETYQKATGVSRDRTAIRSLCTYCKRSLTVSGSNKNPLAGLGPRLQLSCRYIQAEHVLSLYMYSRGPGLIKTWVWTRAPTENGPEPDIQGLAPVVASL